MLGVIRNPSPLVQALFFLFLSMALVLGIFWFWGTYVQKRFEPCWEECGKIGFDGGECRLIPIVPDPCESFSQNYITHPSFGQPCLTAENVVGKANICCCY